ncbi:MAG: glycoside hydrolase family 127 protein [Bacteroidales bacterium]|nr:glycoside hydrolase family 127 protein [Bacteroidales bacterium]
MALRNAELVYKEFGWGRREIAPGHQEIEIGLVKLFSLTGDRRWLELAQFFLDVRGRPVQLRSPSAQEAGLRFTMTQCTSRCINRFSIRQKLWAMPSGVTICTAASG